MNSKNVVARKEQDIRRSRWLGKGLIVEVNENGKRRVSWDRFKCGECVVNWVSRERNTEQLGLVGMGQEPSEAHLPLMGTFKSPSGPTFSSPCVFEAGDCSKTNQDKPSLVLLCPFVCDGVKTSSSTDPSSEKSGSSPTMQPACSVVLPPPVGRLEMVLGSDGHGNCITDAGNPRWWWLLCLDEPELAFQVTQ